MIYAIIAIFISMNQAEQATITELACAVNTADPTSVVYDNRAGVLEVYSDDSTRLIDEDTITVRNSDSLEVFHGGAID